jgi:hypothetical protein
MKSNLEETAVPEPKGYREGAEVRRTKGLDLSHWFATF